MDKRDGFVMDAPAMMDAVLSVVMLAAVALLAGAFVLWRRGVTRQASLMAILAMVMLVNVAIWTLPGEGGTSPVEQARAGAGPG